MMAIASSIGSPVSDGSTTSTGRRGRVNSLSLALNPEDWGREPQYSHRRSPLRVAGFASDHVSARLELTGTRSRYPTESGHAMTCQSAHSHGRFNKRHFGLFP